MIGGRMISAPTQDLWYFPGPVRTPAPTEKLPYLGRGRCLIGPPSTAGQTTWNWPGGPRRSETKFRRTFFAKLSFKKACPVARKGEWIATQVLPAGRNFPPKGPGKTAFWFLCRRGQRNPPPGRRNTTFAGVFLFVCPKRNQKCPGVCLRGVQALQSPTPGPRYGGRFPGAVPHIRRGQGRG
jgi:hypothetical protein